MADYYEVKTRFRYESRSGYVSRDGRIPYKIKFIKSDTLVRWEDILNDNDGIYRQMGLEAFKRLDKKELFGDADILEYEYFHLRIYNSSILPINILFKEYDYQEVVIHPYGVYPTTQIFVDENNDIQTKEI